MNYEEEQRNELEAIEAIYPNELEIISSNFPPIFLIKLKSEEEPDDDPKHVPENYSLTIKFKFVPSYPDQLPEITIEESDNLDLADEEELIDLLLESGKSQLGTVLVFTLVSIASEWLGSMCDRKRLERIESIERKKREEEEMEMKKFEGTKVSVETFMTWKRQFDIEMANLKQKKVEDASKEGKRATGRELFERDKSLIDSDLKFMEEGDIDIGDIDESDVHVDESLFENLDDLDLEDFGNQNDR